MSALPVPVRLAELEGVVARGLATFVEVGEALREIRDSRLYREGHATFEDYCRDRWGWARSTAYAHIDAADVAANVQSPGHLPTLVHAQALAPLSADEQRALAPVIAEMPAREARAVIRDYRASEPAFKGEPLEDQVARSVTTRTLGSSESDEWYTPANYTDAARRVLGGIDLDPASCAAANEVVKATEFFTITDDGLSKVWRGRVFMNPPFGDKGPKFVEKLLSEHASGSVKSAVLLCAARAETKWFHPLFAHTICFPDHRVRFWAPGRVPAPPFTPAFAYLGEDVQKFAGEFSRFGSVVRRV